ncbi:Ubiquitin-conjugating enzyme E2 7 [Galdieria sulphuraria]|nr:Ubiquitin-conjugating enzyme E2 7 [Galdieria sulphuraria]
MAGRQQSQAALLLMKQLKELNRNPDFILSGPPDTLYEGGVFKARLVFPPDYPVMPPTMRFTSEMWHPNVYQDGRMLRNVGLLFIRLSPFWSV